MALEAALIAPDAFRSVVAIAPYLPWLRFRWLLSAGYLLSPQAAAWIPLERIWPLLRWLAGVLGAPEPRVVAADAAPGRRERRSSKRCRNDRLLASGYRLRYPSFREGYRAILAEPA